MPPRDGRKENNLNRELRSENQKLKREVARLQKDLDRRSASMPAAKMKPMRRPLVSIPETCLSCGGHEIKRMDLPSGKRLITCGDCNSRIQITRVKLPEKKNVDSE